MRSLFYSLLLGIPLVLSGCAGMGRSELITNDTENRWETMADLENVFDQKIVADETTAVELDTMGLGPTSNNIKKFEYFDVLQLLANTTSRFTSNIPDPILSCLAAQEGCQAVTFEMKRVEITGKEDPLARVFKDEKIDEKKGWVLGGTIFLKNGVVAYKSKTTLSISELEHSDDPGKMFERIFDNILLDTAKDYIVP